ncbi:MAG: cupin domain-containing protein [Bauldia sp.]
MTGTARLRGGNLFDGRRAEPGTSPEEVTELLARPGVRIERIVSTGQSSPDGFWYDQAADEWVVLLAGAARLQVEGEAAPRTLEPGDYLVIPAHCRHRVDWTDPAAVTVWLAVHLTAGGPG